MSFNEQERNDFVKTAKLKIIVLLHKVSLSMYF